MQLTFGAVPHTDDPSTRILLSQFCEAWSARAGIEIRPHRAPSPSALAAALHRERLQLVWASPTLYLLSPAFSGTHPLGVAVRDGGTRYAGVLFVPAHADVSELDELRGSRIAWGPRSSAAGHIMPRLALAQAGLDPDRFFSSETFFDRHGDVAEAVLSGRADVGATYAVFTGGDPSQPLVRAGFDPQAGRVVLASRPIPSDLLVASPHVSADVRARLAASLRDLGEAQVFAETCWKLFGVDGYRPFEPAAYEELARELDGTGSGWPCGEVARPRRVG